MAGFHELWLFELVDVDIPATVNPEACKFGWEVECILLWLMAKVVEEALLMPVFG